MPLAGLVEKWGLRIDGVLHCGAHLVEEAPQYAELNVGEVCWVEANPAVASKITATLAAYPNQRLVEGLLWSEPGIDMPFHRTNYDGMSSSVLEFGTHTEFSPDTYFVDTITLRTTTIDSIVDELGIKANLLSLDLQGAEGPVLRGGARFLEQVDYVITEVNDAEVYVGATQVSEIDAILADFERVETCWVGDQHWGDALLIRRGVGR